MSPPSSDTPPSLPLPKLDAQAGPARWLPPDASSALVAATLRAHAARRQQRRSHLLQMAAGLALVVGLSAAVSAAWLLRDRDAPVAPQAPLPAELAPLPDEPAAAAPLPAEAPQDPTVALPEPTRVHPTPSDLLAHANELRGRGHWARAARAYERAVRAAPHSQEGYAAAVAAGGLYVERLRDAARGAELFQRALAARPRGALSEEARWGLAQAQRAMGKTNAERAALEAFLRHHPEAALSAQARARLQRLSEAGPVKR